jgi:RNA polymerase sigma-70 factor (ECF subfamily)
VEHNEPDKLPQDTYTIQFKEIRLSGYRKKLTAAHGEGAAMQSDGALVYRCLEGDTEAYGDLVDRYQGAVYATAYYYVGRFGAADDVAQESFLTAYRNLPWLKDGEKFGAWLKSITCRTAANWLRRSQKRLARETPVPSGQMISIEDARLGPRGLLERGERLARVHAAIESLPERYRLPVVLRYLQELTYDEISVFTGESRDEIRGILQRAGRQLRDLLGEADENEGGHGEKDWHPVGR